MALQTEHRWQRNILLVEDDADFREGLADILRSEGYVVRCAANGLEALTYLRSASAPDVILLDLMMPVMNGWDFRQKMLEESALASIPVILMSAVASPDQAESLKAAGSLDKPFELAKLLRMLEGHVLASCAACGAMVVESKRTVMIHGAIAAVLCTACEPYSDGLSRDLENVLTKLRRSRERDLS